MVKNDKKMAIFGYILIGLVALSLFSIMWANLSLAPWVPMWSRDKKRVFALAGLKAGENFYDLGCGNGKIVVYAAKHFDVRATGIELAFPLYAACKLRQIFAGNRNIIFKFGDLFKEDLSGADVVYVYGMPKVLKNKLKEKLERELKPGARVVSYVFKIDGWQPAAVDKPDERSVPIYLYVS